MSSRREKAAGIKTAAQKPVLVWIHGGGNVDGETADYDASKQATGGPLVRPPWWLPSTIAWGCSAFYRKAI